MYPADSALAEGKNPISSTIFLNLWAMVSHLADSYSCCQGLTCSIREEKTFASKGWKKPVRSNLASVEDALFFLITAFINKSFSAWNILSH